MEWRNWAWPNNAPATSPTTLSFQVKLYEATGVVQYSYRQEAGAPVPTGPATNLSATIGLAGGGGFLSLGDTSPLPAVSSTTSTNSLNQRPATGQIYIFTPPTPCPNPTGVTATATSATTATVGFVAGAGNPTTYTVTYSDPAGVTLTTTSPTSPALLTALLPNSRYAVYVASTCGNGASSLGTFPAVYFTTPPLPNTTAIWTGAVSTAWDVAGNWSTGTVPTHTTDVTVPPLANQPTVAGPQVCGALTLQAGTTLTLVAAVGTGAATRLTTGGTLLLPAGSTVVQAAGTALSVGGDFTNNGATLALAPASAVVFGEGGTHALNGTAATALQNLTVGEPPLSGDELTVAAALSVQRLLITQEGGLIQVTPAGSLRLLDNSQGTAQIVRDANGFVAGLVTVEHRLPAGPGRRYYAAPVRGATLAALAAPGFAPVVNPTYNTSPAPAAVLPQPTVFGYDQSRISTTVDELTDFERGYFSPAALSDVLTGGVGYRLDAAGAATLAVTGQLSNSNAPALRTGLTRATLPQSGYHLLGNPYPAALDWDVVAAAPGTTGLDAAVYVPQPAGTWAAYVNGVGGPRYLLPGQAFLGRVSAASTPANVAFPPAARYPAYFDPTAPPAAVPETRPLVQLTLAGPTGPTDGVTAYFQTGATVGFDARFDAHKIPTGGVPYLAFAGSEPLAISGLPVLGPADVTLPLEVRVPATGPYTLTAQLRNLPTGMYAYLRDAQTGAATDLTQQPAVTFALNAATGGPRFSLVLTRTQILAVASAALRQQVALYPNPAHGTAVLELPAALQRYPVAAAVVNALGQTVRSLTLPAAAGTHTLPLTDLAPGIYTVCLSTEYGTIAKQLLVE